MIESGKIIAEEYKWIYDNEPTFKVQGNTTTGKVGRSPNGESILISIMLPEFYPIVKPEVKVLTPIKHPNIDENMNLSLQMLDEWEVNYRLRDIIANTRRLFIKSRKSIEDRKTDQIIVEKSRSTELENEIRILQNEITNLNRKITETKNSRLQKAGLQNLDTITISRNSDLKAEVQALNDLIELLEIKFEEAEIDQTDFFRLYRKYLKERYISEHELLSVEVNRNDISEKEKRAIRN
ncbi:MAG: hypothetical protein INQ03_06725 [Candidatus Heimdallarchaeota archaeon]|nr:hypothetical protein [Candidatus Heimdallarchaeota archaeon]